MPSRKLSTVLIRTLLNQRWNEPPERRIRQPPVEEVHGPIHVRRRLHRVRREPCRQRLERPVLLLPDRLLDLLQLRTGGVRVGRGRRWWELEDVVHSVVGEAGGLGFGLGFGGVGGLYGGGWRREVPGEEGVCDRLLGVVSGWKSIAAVFRVWCEGVGCRSYVCLCCGLVAVVPASEEGVYRLR